MEKQAENQELHALKKQIRIQQSLVITLLIFMIAGFGFILLTGMNSDHKDDTDVNTFGRLDIVEADGNLALSFANSDLAPYPVIDGQEMKMGLDRNMPKITFYDGKGDEVGGFKFMNEETEEGYKAVRSLAFDAYKQDQTLTIFHFEQNGKNETGIRIQDRPDIPYYVIFEELAVNPDDDREVFMEKVMSFREENPERFRELFHDPIRFFAGKTMNGDAVINLHDGNGANRLQFKVTAEGEAFVNFLDESGEVARQWTLEE